MTLSDYDRAKVGDILVGEGDWFTAQLLRLIAKADNHHRALLAKGFPEEVALVETATSLHYTDRPTHYFPPKDSPEVDFGVWWSDGKSYPKYRVSYAQTTGEVYALNLATLDAELLGVVKPDEDEDENEDDKDYYYYRTLDLILDGWGDHCDNDLNGLAWVRGRLANPSLGYAVIADHIKRGSSQP